MAARQWQTAFWAHELQAKASLLSDSMLNGQHRSHLHERQAKTRQAAYSSVTQGQLKAWL